MEVFSLDVKKTSPDQARGQTHKDAALPFQVCDTLTSLSAAVPRAKKAASGDRNHGVWQGISNQ